MDIRTCRIIILVTAFFFCIACKKKKDIIVPPVVNPVQPRGYMDSITYWTFLKNTWYFRDSLMMYDTVGKELVLYYGIVKENVFDKEEYKVRYVDSIAWKVFYYGFYDPDKMKLNSYWYDIVLVIRICDNNTMGVIFEYPYNTRDKLFKI